MRTGCNANCFNFYPYNAQLSLLLRGQLKCQPPPLARRSGCASRIPQRSQLHKAFWIGWLTSKRTESSECLSWIIDYVTCFGYPSKPATSGALFPFAAQA